MHYTKESAIALSGMSKSDRARWAKEGVETRAVKVCDIERQRRKEKKQRNKQRRERRKETRVFKQGEVANAAA